MHITRLLRWASTPRTSWSPLSTAGWPPPPHQLWVPHLLLHHLLPLPLLLQAQPPPRQELLLLQAHLPHLLLLHQMVLEWLQWCWWSCGSCTWCWCWWSCWSWYSRCSCKCGSWGCVCFLRLLLLLVVNLWALVSCGQECLDDCPADGVVCSPFPFRKKLLCPPTFIDRPSSVRSST